MNREASKWLFESEKPSGLEKVTDDQGAGPTPARRQQTRLQAQTHLGWGCGQEEHLVKDCPVQAKAMGNNRGPGRRDPAYPNINVPFITFTAANTWWRDMQITSGRGQEVVVVGWTSISDFCHIPVCIGKILCTTLVDTGSTVILVWSKVVLVETKLKATTVQLRTVLEELAPMEERRQLTFTVGEERP